MCARAEHQTRPAIVTVKDLSGPLGSSRKFPCAQSTRSFSIRRGTHSLRAISMSRRTINSLVSRKAEVVQVCAAMRGMQSSRSLSPDLSQNPRKSNDLANYDLGIALAARAASLAHCDIRIPAETA